MYIQIQTFFLFHFCLYTVKEQVGKSSHQWQSGGEGSLGVQLFKGRWDNRQAGGGGKLHEHEENVTGDRCAQKMNKWLISKSRG